ncbi:Membrane proteinase PrsW, cleaves anti-sigma factor RsiW, M82 family [Tessaracoccus flavus]|nr:Membrane proteinase PrsW, cleaves anti-sigma factor RsiW, M82 family [Tessaracoccus flavus]
MLPLLFIAVGAIGTALGMLVVLHRPLPNTLAAVVPFTVILLIGVWFLNWLDRWEPEPPRFAIGAFLWGAGVSALISGVVNSLYLGITQDLSATAMYSAPLIEESTKALFLYVVLLSTRRGRAEFNSLTDALVYGGLVGLGFAWIEHIGYALSVETLEESTPIIIGRIVLTSYLHPVLTMIVAVGIWAGVTSRGAGRRLRPFMAWLVAVGLHFLHNGSYELFGPWGIAIAAVAEFVAFVTLIVLGVRSRRAERAEIVRQLPAMVHFGWITPLEAGWLADAPARKRMLGSAGAQRRTLHDFIQNTTELALLRGRLDAMPPGSHPIELLQLHGELADLVAHQRPVVQGILARSNGWHTLEARPGPSWGAPTGDGGP